MLIFIKVKGDNMSVHLSLKKVEQAIKEFTFDEQKELLENLPTLVKPSPGDLNFLKLSESSFSFWNNHEDDVYDKL